MHDLHQAHNLPQRRRQTFNKQIQETIIHNEILIYIKTCITLQTNATNEIHNHMLIQKALHQAHNLPQRCIQTFVITNKYKKT